jgi:hypothetical protein
VVYLKIYFGFREKFNSVGAGKYADWKGCKLVKLTDLVQPNSFMFGSGNMIFVLVIVWTSLAVIIKESSSVL